MCCAELFFELSSQPFFGCFFFFESGAKVSVFSRQGGVIPSLRRLKYEPRLAIVMINKSSRHPYFRTEGVLFYVESRFSALDFSKQHFDIFLFPGEKRYTVPFIPEHPPDFFEGYFVSHFWFLFPPTKTQKHLCRKQRRCFRDNQRARFALGVFVLIGRFRLRRVCVCACWHASKPDV